MKHSQAELLITLGAVLAKVTHHEKGLFFSAVLDDVYAKQKKIVAIRPKPAYCDLLRMSPADPTGIQFPVN